MDFKKFCHTPKSCNTKSISLFILMILPALVSILMVKNQLVYPFVDGSDMASVGARISNVLAANHLPLRERLNQAIHLRDWRGISTPLIMGSLFFATDNDLNLSRFIFALIFWTITIYYLLLIGRKYWDTGTVALGIFVIGFLPNLWNSLTEFSVEAIYIPSILAMAYHYSQPNFNSSGLHSLLFALWSTLAITSRPAESGLIFLFVLIAEVSRKLEKKNWPNFAGPLLLFLTASAMALPGITKNMSGINTYVRYSQPQHGSLILPSVFLALILFKKLYSFLTNVKAVDFSLFTFGIPIYLSYFFFEQHLGQVGSWIFNCTIGDFAKDTGGSGSSLIGTLSMFLNPSMTLAVICSIIISIFIYIKRRSVMNERIAIYLYSYVALLVISFLTYNRDSRYHIPGIILAIFFGLNAMKHRATNRLKFALVSLLSILLLANSGIFIWSIYTQSTKIISGLPGDVQFWLMGGTKIRYLYDPEREPVHELAHKMVNLLSKDIAEISKTPEKLFPPHQERKRIMVPDHILFDDQGKYGEIFIRFGFNLQDRFNLFEIISLGAPSESPEIITFETKLEHLVSNSAYLLAGPFFAEDNEAIPNNSSQLDPLRSFFSDKSKMTKFMSARAELLGTIHLKNTSLPKNLFYFYKVIDQKKYLELSR